MAVQYEVRNDRTEEFLEEVKKGVEIAMFRCGMLAQKYATNDAPRDTGHLAQSITFATKETTGTTFSKESTDAARKVQRVSCSEENCMYLGTNVFYAPYQEYGTHTGIKAKHFIKNALQNHNNEYREIIEEELGGMSLKWGKS